MPPTYPDYDADRFNRDTAQHQMTVLHDDGLYRHIRFRRPETGFYWFDLVTWPGRLTITGDMGTYVFARIDDMFEFFRGPQINPDYWAEKLPDGRRQAKEYSEDRFKTRAAEALDEWEKDEDPELLDAYKRAWAEWKAATPTERLSLRTPVPPTDPAVLRAQFAEAGADGDAGFESEARRILAGWEDHGVVSDPWEWDLTDFTWPFLWCCHAIRWGISVYDAARVPAMAMAEG